MASKHESLRARLETDRQRLLGELEQLKSAGQPEERRDGSPFGKREEEATESLELERRLALERQIREQLAEVEASLLKFENKTYGKCESCGQAIDPARLEALPHAKLCLSCKALQAKNARGRFPAG